MWGNLEVPPQGRSRGIVGETWFPPRERAEGERRSCRNPGSLLVHERPQAAEDIWVGVGHHSMTQVEDMTRPPGSARQHVERRRPHPFPRAEEDRTVEVPLDTAFLADDLPAP